MSDQTQSTQFSDFIQQNFTLPDNDIGANYLLGLPLMEQNNVMIGTRNNLTRSELLEFHKSGWVHPSNGKVFNTSIKKPTHFELRLRFTNNIVCIDVDGLLENGDCDAKKILEMDFIKKNLDNCSYTLSRKKKLPHFYFKLDGIDLSQHKGTFVDCFNDFKGDFLINHSWEKIHDNPIFNYVDELQTYYYDDIKDMFKPNIFDKKSENTFPNLCNEDFSDAVPNVLHQVLELINTNFLENYQTWCKIVWSAKNCGITEEFVRHISKKASNYSDDGFDNIWKSTYVSLTQGTIRHYAKLSNEAEYKKLKIKSDYDDTFVIPDGIMCRDTLLRLKKKPNDPIIKVPPDYVNDKKLSKDANKEAQVQRQEEQSEARQEIYERELSTKKGYFEQYHLKLLSPSGFVRIVDRTIWLTSTKDLTTMYENICMVKDTEYGKKEIVFTDKWRKMPNIKTFNTIDFMPPPMICPEHTLNSFTGLKGKLLPQGDPVDISIWERHIMVLTGHNVKGYEYVYNYIAHMAQKPGELPRTALAFNSDAQGVGKNMFFEAIGNMILGKQYMLLADDMEQVLGRFNQSQNKLLIIMDEVKASDAYSNSDKIKSRITSETIIWESKGINSVTMRNFARYILFANGLNIKIEFFDRRLSVFDCDNTYANDPAYLDPLRAFLNDELCMSGVYNALMNRDISNWNPTTDRVQTTLYKDLQSSNKPTLAVFLEERIMNHEHSKLYPDEDLEDTIWNNIPSKELFTTYKQWLTISGYSALSDKVNTCSFSLHLKKYDGITKVKTRSSNNYMFDYDKLKNDLIKKGYMESE